MGKLVEQFLKFQVVGFVTFLIDYGVMLGLTELAGINYLVSNLVSFVVSVSFNYVASMRYVFTHKEGMSRRREFAIFIVVSIVGLGVNEMVLWLCTAGLGVDYRISKIVACIVMRLYNFFTRKHFLDADPGLKR